MKILHTVQFYEPSKGGMQEVVKQISERLVDMGHEVTVVTSKDPARLSNEINGVKIVDFEISGNSVNGISGDLWKYQRFLLDSKFDIMTNFAAQQWATDVPLAILSKISAKKIFVPTGFSQLNNPLYSQYFDSIREKMYKYDANVFSGCYRDYEFAVENGVKNIHIIPNGADEREFLPHANASIREKLGIPHGHFLILHVGSHTGMKGHSEAIKIFNRAKIPNSTLVIVGNTFSKRCYYECKIKEFFGLNIMILDLPREDVIALYKNSNVFLFPSNIECSPIVLFECMAASLPFLSTDVGNAKEIVKWSGGSGQILSTTKDKMGFSHADIKKSADSLNRIYKSKNVREWMAWAGHTKWLERFTWEKIARQYEKLYRSVL